MGKQNKSPGGAGRGNKGVPVVDDPNRPDCQRCGGFMKSKGNSWQCTECGYKPRKVKKDDLIQSFNDSLGFDKDKAIEHGQRISKAKRILVTSAQNNADVFYRAFQTLKQIAKYYKAEIVVLPSHYWHKTLWKEERTPKQFDPNLAPYIVHGNPRFGNVVLKSDIRIRPTTINPLSGKEAHSGEDWVCFGHPQLMRTPIATLEGFPKLMWTTGSITHPSYEVSDAGAKAEFHHCYSALLMEKYDDDFTFIRPISFNDDGHAYDLDRKFNTRGSSGGHRAKVVTPGDEHVKFNSVKKEIYGKGGIVDLLKPEWIVRHDILDGYAGSHHHLKDPMVQYIKHHSGDSDYRAELDECCEFINDTTPSYAKTAIIPSNHHDHLKQFLDKADANKDHTNALLICELQGKMREAALKGEKYDPFYLYAKDKLTCEHVFIDRNTSFMIDGIEYSQHGDISQNGARGNIRTFAKLPPKMVIGHSHQAAIFQGVFSTGVSTDRLEYQRGFSSHSTSLVVQYADGKRSIIDIYDGKFRVKK